MSASNDLNQIKSWLETGFQPATIKFMQAEALSLCDKQSEDVSYPGYNAVSTSQLRNIFSEIKRIEMLFNQASKESEAWEDFLLLGYKVAYNVARVVSKNRASKIKRFQEIFNAAHEASTKLIESKTSDTKKTFARFVRLLEGILAYHKVYGGRD